MVTATLLNNLGAIGEVVAGAAAGLTFIAVVTGALFRLTWPTSIRWAHAYSLTDNAAPNPTLVLNTRVQNRRKQDEQLLHYYVALVPWTKRMIPLWQLRGLVSEVSLEPCPGYVVPPTIKAGTRETTWCKVIDSDLLLSKRRRHLFFGEEVYRYRKFLLVGKDTWHVKGQARLITGYSRRKATRRVRRRAGVPTIPRPESAR